MTTVPARTEVAIVGGGPAGAATAWMLARNNVAVTLYDRARFPRAKPCAEYVNPRALRIASEMGVVPAMERQGAARISGMRIHPMDGEPFEGSFAGRAGLAGFRDHGLGVRREVFDSLLLGAARSAGATVVEGATVRDVTRNSTGIVDGLEMTSGGTTRTVRARHIVGADGLRSVVARRLGLAARRRWPARYAFVTHLRGAPALERGEMHVFDDGYCGISPVGEGLVNFAVVVPASAARAAAGDAEGFLTRWTARHSSLAARLTGAERVSPVLATGPFASHARSASVSGATLVGDAADFFDPFTGEGICAALRGAEIMTPYVVEAIRAPGATKAREATAAYERCRRDEFAAKWRLERIVALAVAWPALMRVAASRLRARRDLADMLVSAASGVVPARDVVSVRFASRLLAPETA